MTSIKCDSPAQMEHELRVNAELGRQSEAGRIILPVCAELGPDANERPIEPANDVSDLLRLAPVHREAGHQHRPSFLNSDERTQIHFSTS